MNKLKSKISNSLIKINCSDKKYSVISKLSSSCDRETNLLKHYRRTKGDQNCSNVLHNFYHKNFYSTSSTTIRTLNNEFYEVSDEVVSGVEKNEAIVALESAIITHGMPYPDNIQTALGIQSLLRAQGVIPATVGVIRGKLKVGLTDNEIEELGKSADKNNEFRKNDCIKISRRDFPYAFSKKLNGGTTVAGTLIGASKAKIPIFVTGGLGGVHRGAEISFDISTDLRELGRNPVAVISAGVKSILDIEKTLEVLETEGVCVCVLDENSRNKTIKFPSFFQAESQFDAPLVLNNSEEAAELIYSLLKFKLDSGMLIACPIPKEAEPKGIETIIEMAISDATSRGIRGKNLTPFLLSQISKNTAGESLGANKELVKNNALIGAKVAIELSKLRKNNKSSRSIPSNLIMSSTSLSKRPVVIGGSSMDVILSLEEEELVSDGRTHGARISLVPGGVGRNIGEALKKFSLDPYLISVVGSDAFGTLLQQNFNSLNLDTSGILISPQNKTAFYSGVLSKKKECLFGLGDMEIYDLISSQFILEQEERIKNAPLLILDGNLNISAMTTAMKICTENSVPVWFEPTEVRKAEKILQIPQKYSQSLMYMSPNWKELQTIAGVLKFNEIDNKSDPEEKLSSSQIQSENLRTKNLIEPVCKKCFEKFSNLELILLTRGKSGFIVIWRTNDVELSFLFVPPSQLNESEILSVSGAGDCLNAGFISALFEKNNFSECAERGRRAAESSLRSIFNVPDKF